MDLLTLLWVCLIYAVMCSAFVCATYPYGTWRDMGVLFSAMIVVSPFIPLLCLIAFPVGLQEAYIKLVLKRRGR